MAKKQSISRDDEMFLLITEPLYDEVLEWRARARTLEALRGTIRRVMKKRFGPVPASIEAGLAQMEDPEGQVLVYDAAIDAASPADLEPLLGGEIS